MSVGFYFDMSRCVGCFTCQVACKDRFQYQKPGPRPRRVGSFETGMFPNASAYHMSISCNHCSNAVCVGACPTGAMHKAEDGTVLHDESLCIGCKACIGVCPYGAPQYLPDEGIVGKCDGCKALRDGGKNPVCVDACPMRALEFGDLEILREKYGEKLVREIPVLPCAQTEQREEREVTVSRALTRNSNKCIHCRRCVSACSRKVLVPEGKGPDTIISQAFGKPLEQTDCSFCGQCALVCPVGAIFETSHKDRVNEALSDPEGYVIAQFSAEVAAAIGECFDQRPGTYQQARLHKALLQMGFDRVVEVLTCDGSCPAVERGKSSPQLLQAEKLRAGQPSGKRVYIVSILPCTAMKEEIDREENKGLVDAVLTTREIAAMIKAKAIRFMDLKGETDLPGVHSVPTGEMACPGGCMMGGGQPRTKDVEQTKMLRMKALKGEEQA